MRGRFAAFLAVAISCAAAPAGVHAAPAEYDFKDPKGVNTIVFMLDSKLEPIMGVADGVRGSLTFDPKNPKATRGTITLEVKSIHIPNRGMKNKVQDADWLDGRKHKTIDFSFKSIDDVQTPRPGVYEMTVVGEITCKGVTKELQTTVSATHMPGKLSSRMQRLKGDLLVLRSNFKINRKDFDINPAMGGDVVAEDIELRVSIVGSHPRK